MSEWISVTVAANMLGYSPDHFRRIFCNPKSPVKGVGILVLWNDGGRLPRYRVLRSDIEALVRKARIGEPGTIR